METVNNKYKVLFVCLGNICRSPAAHGIFEHIVRQNGMQDRIEVDSAGTYSGHRGEMPDRRMRTAALYRGFALTHKARPVSSLAPSVEATHKICRMASYLKLRPMPYIPDPYYMGVEGFSLVLDLLEDGCQNLYDEIIKSKL